MTIHNDEYSMVIEILKEILGRYRVHYSTNHQMSFDCPVCSYDVKGLEDGDGKGNLEVNYGRGVYKCWSCGETHETHGSIYKLIKQYGNRTQLRNYLLYAPETDYVKKNKQVYENVYLPKEYIQFSEASEGIKLTHFYKQALNYLKGRNITSEMMTKHKIGFCYEGKYTNRIIIPSYNKKGYVNYFISRSYERYTKRKYLNPKAEKEEIIWNLHLIDWSKPVYLVEGVFDHIFLDNSIPLLGKKLTNKLFNILYEKAVEVIIVLDGDAWYDTQKIYERLDGGRLYGKVFAIRLTKDEDIADLEGRINDLDKIRVHR